MAHKAGMQLYFQTLKDLAIALAIVAAVLGVVALDGRARSRDLWTECR